MFREIFKKYYLPLKSFAFRYVGNDDIAEDVVQDVFVHMWERRDSFTIFSSVKSFLYVSVRNACLDYLKHERVERENEGGLVSWMTEEDERDFILEEEVDALIYSSISDLSEQARRIVILTMNGASNSNIAAELGISVNTVKTIKLRAYRILRERLGGLDWLLLFIFFGDRV